MSTPQLLPAAADLRGLLASTPQPLDFVLPGLKRGSVGALISPGGTGKSFWALQIGIAIAAPGANLTGIALAPTAGRVLMLSAEDDEDVLALRLHAIVEALAAESPVGSQADLHAQLAQKLDYRSCVGLNVDLMQLEWQMEIRAAAKGCRLIVLDTLTRFHNLDENSAQDMKRLLAVLEKLARETDTAVLYLHHTSKAAAIAGQGGMQQAARGSSVLVDNARWAAFLSVMSESEARRFDVKESERLRYVRWNISKQNYGEPVTDRWFHRRAGGGALVPVDFETRGAQESAPPEAPTATVATPVASVAPDVRASEDLASANAVLARVSRDSKIPAQVPPPPPPLPTANNLFEGKW